MENNLSRKPVGEMMKSTVKNIYELFKDAQIEDVVSSFTCDVQWDATALRGVNGGWFRGRDEVRTMLNNLLAAVDVNGFKYEFVEADEGRGTILSRITMKGKFRNTKKSFVFQENHLFSFENGRCNKIKLWADQREMTDAATNKIMELQRQVEVAFFSGDVSKLTELTGGVKIELLGQDESCCEGCKGPFVTAEEWMDSLKHFRINFNGNEIIHASDHFILVEWTMDEYTFGPTEQSLLGHKPEDFRMFNMLECDDSGKLKKWQIHSAPVPSQFLFMPTGGSYQML